MTEPTFDADGYPTDETLTAIELWPDDDVTGCLDFARAAWRWKDYARDVTDPAERAVLHAEDGDRYVRFATGGWSGNESIIAALKANRGVMLAAWRLHGRGGLHVFQYPRADNRSDVLVSRDGLT